MARIPSFYWAGPGWAGLGREGETPRAIYTVGTHNGIAWHPIYTARHPSVGSTGPCTDP